MARNCFGSHRKSSSKSDKNHQHFLPRHLLPCYSGNVPHHTHTSQCGHRNTAGAPRKPESLQLRTAPSLSLQMGRPLPGKGPHRPQGSQPSPGIRSASWRSSFSVHKRASHPDTQSLPHLDCSLPGSQPGPLRFSTPDVCEVSQCHYSHGGTGAGTG